MRCMYCGKPSKLGLHVACIEEWDERNLKGLCVRCGKNECGDSSFWCDKCKRGGSMPYLGYPGGSA